MITRRICNRLQIRRVIFSRNPVGYSNTNIEKDGQQLQSASFITIGAKDADGNNCVRLSDLKVTGYEEDIGVCYGSIWIDMLHTDGSVPTVEGMPKSYLWVDDASSGFEAGWYDTDLTPLADNQSVLGNADEITFACGEGICFNAQDGYDAYAKLVCNGEVVQGQVDFAVNKDGQQIAGNPLCRVIKLSELSVTGYEEDMAVCYGAIWIDMLHIDGSVPKVEGMPKSYFWYDDPDSDLPAGWYDGDMTPLADNQSVLGNADEIEFKVGEGICINAQDGYDAYAILKFPSLGLKAE